MQERKWVEERQRWEPAGWVYTHGGPGMPAWVSFNDFPVAMFFDAALASAAAAWLDEAGIEYPVSMDTLEPSPRLKSRWVAAWNGIGALSWGGDTGDDDFVVAQFAHWPTCVAVMYLFSKKCAEPAHPC